ncbi:unnamed protein product [Linum tenue]|uniref:Uncharacterized protein n=1 Tax=Linum tenue TaxID=586396 RepID=A0AAV0LW42_9ROSI|nr:unnamed protein product [Linum tenue]
MGILDILKRQSSNSSSSSASSSSSSSSSSRSWSSAKVRQSETRSVPKGHIAVYVGQEERKRFIVPISFLSNPLFLELLQLAEEEFGYNPPRGALTIPCHEHDFIAVVTSS